jgi:hypothetical protein
LRSSSSLTIVSLTIVDVIDAIDAAGEPDERQRAPTSYGSFEAPTSEPGQMRASLRPPNA